MYNNRRINIPSISVSITTLIILVIVVLIICGMSWSFLSTRQQRIRNQAESTTIRAWSTNVALAETTTAAEILATVTDQAQTSATANSKTTSTAQARATSTAQANATVTVLWEISSTAQARATNRAYQRATSTAQMQATSTAQAQAAATIRSQLTATSQARATGTAEAQATSTAQIEIITTGNARATATNQAWSTVVSIAKTTAEAETWATATSQAQATATSRAESGTLLIFEIQQVTVLADKSDGLDGEMEFFMYTVVSDNRSSSGISYPSKGGAISVSPGESIAMGQYLLAINEKGIDGDEITIDIVAIDVDDQSIDEEIFEILIRTALDYGAIGSAKRFTQLARFVPLIRELAESLEKPLDQYFDLISEDEIILRRSENWSTEPLLIHRKTRGLDITYRVYLTDKAPLPPAEFAR